MEKGTCIAQSIHHADVIKQYIFLSLPHYDIIRFHLKAFSPSFPSSQT